VRVDAICYPARGYMPVSYFGDRHVWSVSLKPWRFKRPSAAEVVVQMYRLDERMIRAAEPLPLDVFHVLEDDFDGGICVVFRPKPSSIEPGTRYWVDVSLGSTDRSKKATAFRYLVHFVRS